MESSPLRLTPPNPGEIEAVGVVERAIADALWPFRVTGFTTWTNFEIWSQEWTVHILIHPWDFKYIWSGDALEEAVFFHVSHGVFNHFRFNRMIKPEANIVLGEN